jgi:predicted nucleic acid-binding protein
MPIQSLERIPDGSDVFIDANIFIYGLGGLSAQCKRFLDRCSREEVIGISLFEIVNNATHRFMLAEAHSKGLISKESASGLRGKFKYVPNLTIYWQNTERILNLNLLLIAIDEPIIRVAHSERQNTGLLTNDSMIVSCMRSYGVSYLATSDNDFERVSGIMVFRPEDLP